ncbi:N-acyl amino acid synthase FeeM domain-containing protein [Phreatobacter sp.]|uniref:N-acyl amino acid synthase FeeM domain-containing protein n=1 Tax=Phreatobacter sp. TaxID=1966341 RepID=UPI003F7114CB
MNTVNVPSAFANNVTELLGRLEYRLAVTKQDKQAIYRLRYACYLREGAIRRNKSELFHDRFDRAPNVWIFGVYLGDVLASSIRVHVATPDVPVSPGLSIFGDILNSRIDRGETIVDPTRFVVDPDLSRRYPALAYATVRLGMLASEYFDADYALATVRREHRAFYRRLLCMEPVAEPRRYPSLKEPINLMGVSFPLMRQRVYDRYPFMISSGVERDFLFGRTREGREMREAIVARRSLMVPAAVAGQAAA